MQCKDGFSYILTCVLILAFVMGVFVSMQYAYVFHIAREQRNETQLKLDSFITKQAISNYDAFKQGEPYQQYIDNQALVDGAYSVLGFPRMITLEYKVTQNEKAVYTMSRPEINRLAGNSVGVYVKYTLTIPFEVFGRTVANITVPVEIVSRLTEK